MTSPRRAISLDDLPDYARAQIAAATAYGAAPLDRHAFPLPALRLELCAGSDALAELCRARLVRELAGSEPVTYAQVFALDATMAGWQPPALWDTRTGFSARAFDARLAAHGLRGFYHHDAPSWQFYDPTAGTGVYCLPAPLAVPPWEQGSPLRLFMHWAYAAAGLRLAHAATLGMDGRGVLLVGRSGSGKSGTTLAGILHGLTSTGDDYVLLQREGTVIARSVFRAFKQDEAGLRRVGLRVANLPGATLNWAGKYEFDAAALAPEAIVEALAIDAIVIPEIAGACRTEITPAPVHEAALRLAPSAVFQLPGDATESFRFYSELARTLPAYKARLGSDPSDVADAFRRLLAETRSHVA